MAYTEKQIGLLRQLVGNVSDQEFGVFMETCERTGLDPFRRQIHALTHGGKVTAVISIDGFRTLAERTGKYVGQKSAEYCGEDGIWTDSWPDNNTPPVAARVAVLRSDFKKPCYATAYYSESVQAGPAWKKMPRRMLAKVAEAQAIRQAFPLDLSGLYVTEELPAQAPNVAPAAPAPKAEAQTSWEVTDGGVLEWTGLASPDSTTAKRELYGMLRARLVPSDPEGAKAALELVEKNRFLIDGLPKVALEPLEKMIADATRRAAPVKVTDDHEETEL